MDAFIKFHCNINANFHTKKQQVRAFTYYDYQIEPHTHDFYEINVIMKGEGRHTIVNNTIDAVAGDVFVIPPQIVHAYTNIKNLDVYHILIKPNFIADLLQKEQAQGFKVFLQIEPLLRQNVSKSLFLQLTASQLTLIKYDLDCLSEDSFDIYPNSDEFNNYTVLKLLSWFSHLIMQQNSIAKAASDSYTENIMIKLVNYIYENYSNTITIDELCKISNMSRATLFRKFKAYCNCSPMDFIINYRINVASSLIEKGNQTKTTIAQECGFYDLSHMEKVLKRL